MDRSIVSVDESHTRNESLGSGSNCSGSLVPINSIAIDINCAREEIESPKHEHFSIRGYVYEKRKKDKKTCLPFASEADDDESDNINLPPLSAPKYRWWQCSECVLDQKNTLGMIVAEQTDAGKRSYQNVVVGEKDNYVLTHCIQNIGDEHGSRDSRDCVADEPGNVSSGSDEIMFSALPHKRKRKLRSLAEIINKDKCLTSEQYPKTKSAQIEEADLNNQSHELEDSSDAKVTKTHHRKRKLIILDEDDIEPLEMGPPIVTAKRSKGPVTEAEHFILNLNNNNNNGTCKQIENFKSDSERDNRHALLDLRVSAKTQQQHKARKQRSLDINRKTKRINTEKRKTVTTNETGFSNMGNVGLFVKDSLFGKQMDNVSDMSKGKRPVEGDYGFYYVPPSNKSGPDLDLSLSSFTGAEINSEKQETSRKYTGIPDLNESIIEKTFMPDPTLHENLDISASSGKETGREGKRPLVEHQPVQNTGNNTVGASDDIPMEIVELLAKKQLDRALDNSRKLLVPDDIHNPFRRSAYAETTPGPINFSYTNVRSGLSGNIRPVQGFLNFPPSTNSDKNQFRRFSPLTLGQSYSGPNPISSAPRPRPSEGSDLLWPPRRRNVTFDLNGAQNRSIQPNNGLEDPSYNGKSVNYMKGDGKIAMTNGSSIKKGKTGTGHYKSVGSIDAYSNETIPAMQLLSLMDQGIVSGSSFKDGPNYFANRQLSPCNHHPRLNKNNNQQNDPFISSSFFAQSDRSKDFPTLLNGVRYSGDSSKKSFSQGRMPQQNGSSKGINLAGPSNAAAQPSRSNLNLEVCTLNRNPADFSIPDAKNEFMISAKDLKPKKRNSSKEKPGARNVEGPKRQKVKKDLSRKDNSRK